MPTTTIGFTLKDLRKKRNMTLKELADETGVSISFLSQVERGKSSVTLESLRKIADALNVDPSTFFADSDAGQDELSERLERFYYKDLSNGVTEADFSPILVTLHPGENEGSAFAHNSYEFIFVVEGILTVEVDGRQFELGEQQSIMFDARKTHYWFNLTDRDVRFLVVSSKTK